MRRTIPIDPNAAARLAARRRAAGLTQNALALAAGLSEASISKLETARVPLYPSALEAIDRVLAKAEQRVGAAS